MDRWENRISSQGIHYSRYIASYVKICTQLKTGFYWREFYTWLKKIGLNETEAKRIANLADDGKLELETNAMIFLKNLQRDEEEP